MLALASVALAAPQGSSRRAGGLHANDLLAGRPRRGPVRTDREYRGDGTVRRQQQQQQQQQQQEEEQQQEQQEAEQEGGGDRRRRFYGGYIGGWPNYGGMAPQRKLPTHIGYVEGTDQFAVKHLEWVLKKACPEQAFTSGPPIPAGAGAPENGQFLIGAAAAPYVPSGAFDALGEQAFFVDSSSNESHILLSGRPGHSRGTLLAVSHLLHALGVRHLAATETVVPSCPRRVPRLSLAEQPSFEYRDNDQLQISGNAKWASLVGYNGVSINETDDKAVGVGGRISYATPPGFVHTVYALLAFPNEAPTGYDGRTKVPPTELAHANPEWFWPQGGYGVAGQVCWSQPGLVQFLIKQCLDVLAEQPDSQILSVSQEDNGNQCQSAEEMAINHEEGSDMGAMLRAINTIADAVGRKYPNVAIDTLAYQWSRAPPRRTVPRPNVIIRLCTIECDFAHSMHHPHNEPFVRDLEGWARISNRTYVWDYITNFQGYVAPFPNWYRLGPTLRFLHERGVRGVFAEGVYNGHGGGDLAELKDYVIARMMMNVSDDGHAAIREFIDGYYGPRAAPFVRMYMNLMHGAVDEQNYHLGFSHDANAPFLSDPAVLLAAADAFARAERVSDGRFRARVRRAAMGVHYVALHHWAELHNFTATNVMGWPFPQISKRAMFEHFQGLVAEFDVTLLDEWGGNVSTLEEKLFSGRDAFSSRGSYGGSYGPVISGFTYPVASSASAATLVSLPSISSSAGSLPYHGGAALSGKEPYRPLRAPAHLLPDYAAHARRRQGTARPAS